jgi:hypothetical protein
VEKRHSKKIAGVTSSSARLTEDPLLPMLIAIDQQTGEIVAQVTNFSEYFANKQAITPESKIFPSRHLGIKIVLAND